MKSNAADLVAKFVDGTPLSREEIIEMQNNRLLCTEGKGHTYALTEVARNLLPNYMGDSDSASGQDGYAMAQDAQNQQARKMLDALDYKNRVWSVRSEGDALDTLAGGGRTPSALDSQIGGEHYRNMVIQPIEFIEKNGIRFLEGCIIKRAARHDKKTGAGAEDLRKIIHEASLLLELRYGVKA